MKFLLVPQRVLMAILLMFSTAKTKEVFWDLPSTSPTSIKAAVDLRSNQRLFVCSDDRYNEKLKEIGFDPHEIALLPKPTFTQLKEAELTAFLNVLSTTCTLIPQGMAKINNKPTVNSYFITHSIIDCVGIAIHTPQATYFSHMDMENLINGKLERLLERIPHERRPSAQVTLISSHYSVILRDVFKTLKTKNFKTIQADIEPCIMVFSSDLKNISKYTKASSYGQKVEDFEALNLAQLANHINQSDVVAPRSLIMDAKTGAFYTLTSYEERYKETTMLFKFEQLGAFGAKK